MANVIVAEDEQSQDIHIPSVFISKNRGQQLIDAVSKSEVVLELAWNVPINHVVAMDLWMSSASQESLKFLRQFAPNRRMLNGVLAFNPHYAVFGMEKGAAGTVGSLCSDERGRYCAEDPDGDGPITGLEVLNEDVRQLCLHDLTKVAAVQHGPSIPANMPPSVLPLQVEYSAQFWDYIENFMNECPLNGGEPDRRFGKVCSHRLLTKAGGNKLTQAVQQCVDETTEQKLKKQRENIAWSPRALRINGWRYSGVLDADLVTRAICAGFINTPAQCKLIIEARDPFKLYNRASRRGSGLSFQQLIGWLFIISAVFITLMLLYVRHQRKELRDQVREEVMLEVEACMSEYSNLRG